MPDQLSATQASKLGRSSEPALRRLLHNLEPFVRAYPIASDDEMPDHDIKWVNGLGDDNVAKVVAEIMKAYPALWLHALPDDVCVVPRKSLKSITAGHPFVAEHLEQNGIAIVESYAARLRHEIEVERSTKKR